jgi:hypothetical protein
VTTVAGNGYHATINGFGTAAAFHSPRGICIDIGGNLIVTQVSSHCIRRIVAGLTLPPALVATPPTAQPTLPPEMPSTTWKRPKGAFQSEADAV